MIQYQCSSDDYARQTLQSELLMVSKYTSPNALTCYIGVENPVCTKCTNTGFSVRDQPASMAGDYAQATIEGFQDEWVHSCWGMAAVLDGTGRLVEFHDPDIGPRIAILVRANLPVPARREQVKPFIESAGANAKVHVRRDMNIGGSRVDVTSPKWDGKKLVFTGYMIAGDDELPVKHTITRRCDVTRSK